MNRVVIFAIVLLLLASTGQIQASVSGGTATISISPSTRTIGIGQSLPITVSFNTAGTAISAIAMRLTYSYSGASPQVSASNIQINSTLVSSGDWTCPVKTTSADGGTVKVDIACANTSTSGFSTTTNTSLATFTLTANQAPSGNAVALSFDPAQSIITRKSDSQDILRTPANNGSYTVTTGSGGGGNQSTNTNSPSNQPAVGGAPAQAATPTSKPPAKLPVTADTMPTVFIASIGTIIVIIGISLLFAL